MRLKGLIWGIGAVLLLSSWLPAGAVELRYGMKKGEEVKYSVRAASVSRMSGMGEDVEVKGELDLVMRLRVLEVASNGEMDIEQEIVSGKIEASSGEEKEEITAPNTKTKFKLSRLGKITQEKASAPKEEERDGGDDLSSMLPFDFNAVDAQMDMISSGLFFPLPEREVNAGDSWEDEIEIMPEFFGLPEKTTDPIWLNVESKLEKLTSIKGEKCAKIESKYEILLDGEDRSDPMMTIRMGGKIVGAVEWYYYYEQSHIVLASGKMKTLVKLGADFAPEIKAMIPPEMNTEGISTMIINLKTKLIEN